MTWSTGPVGVNHRAIMRDGTVVAVAESVEEAAFIVRTMNETPRKLRDQIRRIANDVHDLGRDQIVNELEALL